jgi:tRNA pseudouridine38-40 synthase
MATRWALRVAYDGTAFHGSQRQPDVRTVEGELLDALSEVGAGEDPEELAFQAASRTDQGVSAAGNVVAFTTSFPSDRVAEAVAGQIRDAWIVGKAQVDETFLPRQAGARRYRYLLPPDEAPAKDLSTVLEVFAGVHDFAGFAETDEGESTERAVHEVEVRETPRALHVDVEGDAFLRHQIRRMVGAALSAVRGEVEVADLEESLGSGEAPASGWPPAPAEHLVLLDVRYEDVDWKPVGAGGLRRTATQADLFAERFQLLASEAPP